jgi:hypothetical protein
MFTRKQVINRLKPFIDEGVPVSNYGMAIAWINGILPRVVKPLGFDITSRSAQQNTPTL